MSMKRIAIITEKSSDILQVLLKNKIDCVIFTPGQIKLDSFDEFYSIAILGGAAENPIMFSPRERLLVEEQLHKGKKIFAEYCASIGHIYCEAPVRTRYDRLAFCSEDVSIKGLQVGDMLDDQCGMRIRPYPGHCSDRLPILQFVKDPSHSKVKDLKKFTAKIADRALWFDNPENLLVSSFKLANYNRARFASKAKFKGIIKFILEWLVECEIDMDVLMEYYQNGQYIEGSYIIESINISTKKAMSWFENAGILQCEGKEGVYEGLGTEIMPDGKQQVNTVLRNDCIGEVALAYFMDSLLRDDKKSREISDNLAYINFEQLQCKDNNEFHGMMRWTQQAWGVCYQDDVARAVIPQLLKCLYTGEKLYLKECVDALNFLVRTTGTDGTRPNRTDNVSLNKAAIEKLATTPANFPSAHYNAYYYAALLLGYKLTKEERFRDIAVKGPETIMKAYPDTIREMSQTEEYCRLILPLSWLFWVTNEERHKGWLYLVTNDLQRFKHTTGAYLEWDDGYKATMRNKAGEGESSLLAANGEPVIDLLYSNNWLPIGFIQAYFVTGDIYFKALWEEIAKFMINAQVISEDKQIDGVWARGFDVSLMEVFGSPADVGWGPWAVESGWTMGEIAAGLIMGLLEDKLVKFYVADD